MTEQHFYAFQSCSMIEHRGCEGVPKHMRRTLAKHGNVTQSHLDSLFDLRAVDTHSLLLKEEGLRLLVSNLSIAFGAIDRHRSRHLFSERYNTLLATFSRHLQFTVDKTDVFVIESHQFGQPNARLIEYDEYRTCKTTVIVVSPT